MQTLIKSPKGGWMPQKGDPVPTVGERVMAAGKQMMVAGFEHTEGFTTIVLKDLAVEKKTT